MAHWPLYIYRYKHTDHEHWTRIQMMDWITWLSKTELNPALVHKYGLAFTRNELEEDDLSYFDHELLHSMGISIAKHRLEILKLVHKHRHRHPCRRWAHRLNLPLQRLLLAIKISTERGVEKYINSWVHNDKKYSSSQPSTALLIVHKDNFSRPSNGCHGTLLKRKKTTAAVMTTGNSGHAGARFLLTNGSSTPAKTVNSFSGNPSVYASSGKEEEEAEEGYWLAGVEEMIRWESLFQDLQPT